VTDCNLPNATQEEGLTRIVKKIEGSKFAKKRKWSYFHKDYYTEKLIESSRKYETETDAKQALLSKTLRGSVPHSITMDDIISSNIDAAELRDSGVSDRLSQYNYYCAHPSWREVSRNSEKFKTWREDHDFYRPWLAVNYKTYGGSYPPTERIFLHHSDFCSWENFEKGEHEIDRRRVEASKKRRAEWEKSTICQYAKRRGMKVKKVCRSNESSISMYFVTKGRKYSKSRYDYYDLRISDHKIPDGISFSGDSYTRTGGASYDLIVDDFSSPTLSEIRELVELTGYIHDAANGRGQI